MLQGWTNGPSSISSGQYMQVEETTSASGGVTTQATVIAGGTASIWTVATTGSCAGLPGTPPPVGTVCADGTVYAGTSPDTSVPMFTTQCDLGQTWNTGSGTCTGSQMTYTWNNGSSNWIDDGQENSITGRLNTANLVASVDIGSPYYAAVDCNSLSTSGITEGSGAWYLPSKDELGIMQNGAAAIGHFDLTGNWYWSSSENGNGAAWLQRFSDGTQSNDSKNNTVLVRCVRR